MTFSYFLALILIRSIPAFSKPPSSSNPSDYEQIDHAHFLVDDISKLYLNERFSDVVFVVDNEELHAHRLVLATHSGFFSKYFYGSFDESGRHKVKIKEVSVTSFKILLKYSYTGRINLSRLEDAVIVELFKIAHYYGFSNLQHSLSEYFRSNITIHNACSLFAIARLYQHEQLDVELLDFIESHTLAVLESEDFLFLPPQALQDVLSRDSFAANELDIFRAVCRWIDKHQLDLDADTKTNVLSVVRYPLISDKELLSVVSKTQLVSSKTIADVIKSKKKTPSHELKLRGETDVNFVQSAKVNTDINRTATVTNIDLGHTATINYIKLNLQYKDFRIYTYYIEVSTNQKQWVRVIDHSKYPCRAIQRLWISPQAVRYVKIVGVYNTDEKSFKILEIKHNTREMHLVDIKNGLVAPKYNVALISMDATVIKEYRFSNNSILDGQYKHFDNNYTCHRLQLGCIEVQLAQPYMLSSMRMLLWDKNDGDLSYIVEVSVNHDDWDKIVDKSNELTKSWQLLQFDFRPVVYIRITGVYNSASTIDFHVAHLEAPAQVDLASYPTSSKTTLSSFVESPATYY
ncbi:BTB/POZ domain-containing protein 9-like [Adelges cooleyi]|uniref:BTB/POZ domain-containing protein 9-like n=1 Tax=Adelges cooleyi TaxID=133065 RepID=UPI00217F4DFD|nr:BTB/POZ domain-containing protein 9-like [Adelges cooleyi]